METFKKISQSILILLALISLGLRHSLAQETKQDKAAAKEEAVKQLVLSKEFVFIAEDVRPTGGGTRHLTSEYLVSITSDTIRSYLPYFGKAYNPSINPTDAGINFTSKDFEYAVSDRKKGGWDISIKPKDQMDIDELRLTVFENGNSSLQVSSSNRQPISYNGRIEANKAK